MKISVTGQHISLGAQLQTHVNDRLAIMNKYFANAPSATVNFVKEGYEIKCDIILNDGTGRNTIVKSSNSSTDIYSAFDSAVNKLEAQVRKYKSKLHNRSNRTKLSEVKAVKYILQATNAPDAQYDAEENVGDEEDNPVIIAEKPAEINSMSVSEAVMQMDLHDLPALMFENSKTGRMNVVYYRKDGNISWVDSQG